MSSSKSKSILFLIDKDFLFLISMNSLTLYLILVPVVGFILLLVNILLAKHVPYSEKVTSYECGFSPIYGQNRSPFTIQFYLVGILFLIFDIEIFMTMPYALTIYETGHYGFWIIMVFFGILTLGFVYEFNSKALYFSQAQPANEEELSTFPSIFHQFSFYDRQYRNLSE